MELPPFLSESASGVRIDLLVVPRASRTRIVGEHGGRLKMQVAAPPVDGAANKEVRRFLSRCLGVPKGAVQIVQGESGRRKVVEVGGQTPQSVAEALKGS